MSATPQTARLRIRHESGFSYEGLARASYNEARMTPVSSNRQQVLEAALRTQPGAIQATYRDYFGTVVTAFDLQEPHDRLVVTATATVDTTAPGPRPTPHPSAERQDPGFTDRYCEYLSTTPRTALPEEVADELVARFGSFDAHEAAHGVTEWVRHEVRYVPGATHVHSTAAEVLTLGEGVCQDLTHVALAALRLLGIPARYVSGYLHPERGAELGVAAEGQSHAWLDYLGGEWVGIDPTNGSEVGLHHVVVAHGRDYADVPPLKGIYHGAPSRALGVVVEITQLA